MTDSNRNPSPKTHVDVDTGNIWTRNEDTDAWENSSLADAKPRMLAVDAVTGEDLKDGVITEPKLADDAVSTRTIIDANVTLAKLAADVLSFIGSGGGSGGEVLMTSGVVDPPDPLISSDGTDWLYGEE